MDALPMDDETPCADCTEAEDIEQLNQLTIERLVLPGPAAQQPGARPGGAVAVGSTRIAEAGTA